MSAAVVLMYHRIAVVQPDVWRLCTPPPLFREHLAVLNEYFRPTSLHDLTRDVVASSIQAGTVAVTLDDGSYDNYTVASEILRESKVPATFFIPTDRLLEPHEFWWDTLERIFISSQRLPRRLDLTTHGGCVHQTETEHERTDAHDAIAEMLRGQGADGRDSLVARIGEWAGIETSPRTTHRAMLATEVRELAQRAGHTIGSHGVHHLSLPAMPVDVRRQEMAESKATLEKLLQTSVTCFAYPYGHCDDATVNLAAAHFDTAVTTSSGAVIQGTSPLAVPRIDAASLSREGLLATLKEACQ